MNDPAQIQILIDIRAKLEELTRGQTAMRGFAEDTRDANREANSLTAAFKTGFGIDVARRGLSLLTNSLRQSVGEAFRLAGSVKDMSEALGLSTSDYQVLGLEFKNAGADLGRLTEAVSTQTRSLVDARDVASGSAKAYAALGLSAALLERLPVAERMIAVARAVQDATDKTAAFSSASQILGSRGLPQLMNALQRLAREGLGEVSAGWVKAGQVMSDDTIARLDRASKAWEALWRGIVTLSGEALANLTHLATVDKTEQLVASWRRVLDLEAKSAEMRKRGVEPPLREREKLGPAVATYAAYAVRSGDETHIRAARARAQLIAPGDTGMMSAMDRKAVADVEVAYARLEAAAAKAREQTAAHATARKDELATQKGVAASAALRAEHLEREKNLLAGIRELMSGANTEWDRAQDIISSNLTPLERYNYELARLAQTAHLLPEDFLERARAAAGETLRAGQAAETEKQLAPMRARIEAALVSRQEEVAALKAEADRLSSRTGIDATTQQRELAGLYDRIRGALIDIIALEKQELALIPETDPVKRAQQTAKIAGLERKRETVGSGEPLTGLAGVRQRTSDRVSGPNALTGGEGIEAGALNFVGQLGSQGEQVAQQLQSTLGTTVANITDEITNWITETQSFGDALANIGQTFALSMLRAFVQMVAQYAVSKAAMFALDVAFAAKSLALSLASAAKSLVAWIPAAIAAGISSYGMAAAIGVAAVVAAMAAFGGFAEGGYTGDGAASDPAGIVHRREIVWSEKNINDAGGVAAVEALRQGLTPVASLDDLPVPSGFRATALPGAPTLGGGASLSKQVSEAIIRAEWERNAFGRKRERTIVIVKDMNSARALEMDASWDHVIVDAVRRNLGEIWEGRG